MPILYHYCSTATFHNIVGSKALWLSSLTQSNDSSEGRVVSQAVARLATKDNLSDELTGHLLAAVSNMEGLFDGLGLCFSTEGDLLSQWRAYTQDGAGLSVGFDKDYVEWLAESSRGTDVDFELKEVHYKPEIHDRLVAPAYTKLRCLLESDDDFPPGKPGTLQDASDPKSVELCGRLAVLTLLQAAMESFGEVFSLKHEAFAEEKEWRLLHYFGWLPTNPCLYRTAAGRIVPYKVCALRDLSRRPVIEVVLGPRHTTPIQVVENYLTQHGFGNVKVKQSIAPYR